jgi:hypothetical protein
MVNGSGSGLSSLGRFALYEILGFSAIGVLIVAIGVLIVPQQAGFA